VVWARSVLFLELVFNTEVGIVAGWSLAKYRRGRIFFFQNGASFDRTGSLPAAPGDPMLLPCTGLNRQRDGVGVLVMARRKSGARLPPQPSAFMKFAAGSTWTCMKMGDAQDMLPSTYQPPEWT